MRIPDDMLKGTVFIAEKIHSSTESSDYDLQAAAFWIAYPSKTGGDFLYLATAKHVVDDLKGRPVVALVNSHEGGVAVLEVAEKYWHFHPTDPTVDVAVLPAINHPHLNFISIPTDLFLLAETRHDHNIGIGDDTFTVGLFTYHAGTQRNMRIVRHGNIAMLPDEPIQVDNGFAEVYLVEARSIGGLSGSPVFVRKSISLRVTTEKENETKLQGLGRLFFLGMMRGHWDIRESDMNKPSFIQDRQRGVNLGIGMVTPASKILEVINHPDLVSLRERREQEHRKAVAPGLDGV